MSLSVTQFIFSFLKPSKAPSEPKYYIPFPKQVMTHLEQKQSDLLSPRNIQMIALGLEYDRAVSKDELHERIACLDVALPQPWITTIVHELWKIRLTQSEKSAQFRQKMGNRGLCVCNDDHLLFPEASIIRRYVNTHHAKDMTKSQRQSLINTLENTRTCSSKLFDLLDAMRPNIADTLHKSLLCLAQIDAPHVDLVGLELKEIEALELSDGISISDVSEESQSEVSEVFYEEDSVSSDSSDRSLENEDHSLEYFDDLVLDPKKKSRVHRNFELQRAAKLHSSK